MSVLVHHACEFCIVNFPVPILKRLGSDEMSRIQMKEEKSNPFHMDAGDHRSNKITTQMLKSSLSAFKYLRKLTTGTLVTNIHLIGRRSNTTLRISSIKDCNPPALGVGDLF